MTGVTGGAAGAAGPQEGHEGEKEGDLWQLLQSAGPVTLVPLAAECRVCNEEVTIKYRYCNNMIIRTQNNGPGFSEHVSFVPHFRLTWSVSRSCFCGNKGHQARGVGSHNENCQLGKVNLGCNR